MCILPTTAHVAFHQPTRPCQYTYRAFYKWGRSQGFLVMEGCSGDVKTCPALRPHPLCGPCFTAPLRLIPPGSLWSLLHTPRLMGQPEGPHHLDNLVLLFSLLHWPWSHLPAVWVASFKNKAQRWGRAEELRGQRVGMGTHGSYREGEMWEGNLVCDFNLLHLIWQTLKNITWWQNMVIFRFYP